MDDTELEVARSIVRGDPPSKYGAVKDVALRMGFVEFEIARRIMLFRSCQAAKDWALIRSCLQKRDMRHRLQGLFDILDRVPS